MKTDFIVTFQTTHQSMKAEKALKQTQLKLETIPTPRKISQECGFAILIKNSDIQNITQAINEYNIKFRQIFKINYTNGVKEYEKIY